MSPCYHRTGPNGRTKSDHRGSGRRAYGHIAYGYARVVLPAIGSAPERNPKRLCQSAKRRKGVRVWSGPRFVAFACGLAERHIRDAWTSAGFVKRKGAKRERKIISGWKMANVALVEGGRGGDHDDPPPQGGGGAEGDGGGGRAAEIFPFLPLRLASASHLPLAGEDQLVSP